MLNTTLEIYFGAKSFLINDITVKSKTSWFLFLNYVDIHVDYNFGIIGKLRFPILK